MDCRYCGSGITGGKLFCGEDCRLGWREMHRTAPYLFPGEGLTPGEIARRRELFRQAREGRAEALTALKANHGVTGIWDGKKLIQL